jgi:peptidoglycan/xylan/chitin deacetylase (PgdA/CDA1 family)
LPFGVPHVPHVYKRRRLVGLGVVAGALLLALLLAVGAMSASTTVAPGTSVVSFTLRSRLRHEEAAHRIARQNRAIDALLKERQVLRAGSGREREVALTFDDGPSPYTGEILDTLVRMRAPATFFPIGFMIDEYPAAIQREVEHGFAIGDHTENHARLAGLPAAEQEAELLDQATELRHQGAPFPRLFRPPFGVYDDTTLKLARRNRMLVVLWTVETADYEQPGDEAIVQRVLESVRPGAIILLHDGGGDRSETVAAVPKIIRELRDRGYRLVTIPRLALDSPPGQADSEAGS